MKYKQKVEIELEFEAVDIAEWKDPQTGEKIRMIVTKAEECYLKGIAFYDDREPNHRIPHFVIFEMTKYSYKVRKVPESEWRVW